MIDFKNLSWPQFAILGLCLVAPIVANKFGGPVAVQVSTAAGVLIAWLTNSKGTQV